MKAKIKGLNARYLNARIPFEQYAAEARRLLCNLDWQKRIQYENMLYM